MLQSSTCTVTINGLGMFTTDNFVSPQAGVHSNPCLLQVHLQLLQPALQVAFQLIFSFGADGLLLITATNLSLEIHVQSHSNGSR